jgi:hypothetical protein
LIAIAGTWILLHLLGFSLMYRGGLSLVQEQSEDPATVVQTVAFVGSALSTMGALTVQVTAQWWYILSMVAAVKAMVVLNLSVSFLLNILQAKNNARTFLVRFRALKSESSTRHPSDVLKRVAGLGPDLCRVVVQLTASRYRVSSLQTIHHWIFRQQSWSFAIFWSRKIPALKGLEGQIPTRRT